MAGSQASTTSRSTPVSAWSHTLYRARGTSRSNWRVTLGSRLAELNGDNGRLAVTFEFGRGRVSEPAAESSIPLTLDVVKAKIFYLASDIEEASATAAKLLRAVAETVDEETGRGFSAPAKSNGVREKALPPVSPIHTLEPRVRVAAPASEPRLGVVNSQAGYKR